MFKKFIKKLKTKHYLIVYLYTGKGDDEKIQGQGYILIDADIDYLNSKNYNTMVDFIKEKTEIRDLVITNIIKMK